MKFSKLFKIAAIGAGVLLILVFLVGPPIFRHYTFRGHPGMSEAYQNYRSEPFAIPADSTATKPLSPETQQALADFQLQWKQQQKGLAVKTASAFSIKLLQSVGDPSASFSAVSASDPKAASPDELRAALTELAPTLAAIRRLALRPDYTIDLLAPQSGLPANPIPQYLEIQTLAKLLAMQCRFAVIDGHSVEALEASEAILALARTGPYGSLTAHLVSDSIASIGASAEVAAMSAANDASAVRGTLETQNRLAGELHSIDWSKPIPIEDQIAALRGLAAEGEAIKLPEQATAREMMSLVNAKQADALEAARPAAGDGASLNQQQYAAMVQNYRSNSAVLGGPVRSARDVLSKLTAPYAEPILFKTAAQNFEEAQTRERTAFVKVDLMRLETARKLYEVEKGKAPENLSMLAPEYLAEIPADRFGKNGEAYRLAGGTIYSVGPDGADQSASTLYDPSNGTTSSGDVYLVAGKLETPSAGALPK